MARNNRIVFLIQKCGTTPFRAPAVITTGLSIILIAAGAFFFFPAARAEAQAPPIAWTKSPAQPVFLQDSSKNLYFVGVSTGNPIACGQISIVKTDPLDNVIWSNLYSGTPGCGNWNLSGAVIDPFGNIYASAQYFDLANNADFELLLKIDSAGNLVWSKTSQGLWSVTAGYGITGMSGEMTCCERPDPVDVDAAGNTYVAANVITGFTASGVNQYIYVVKRDPSGNVAWTSRVGGYYPIQASVIEMANGAKDFAVSPSGDHTYVNYTNLYYSSYSSPPASFLAAAWDASGVVLWTKQYPQPSSDIYGIFAADGTGYYSYELVPFGYPASTNFEKFDTSGNPIWMSPVMADGARIMDVGLGPDGNIYSVRAALPSGGCSSYYYVYYCTTPYVSKTTVYDPSSGSVIEDFSNPPISYSCTIPYVGPATCYAPYTSIFGMSDVSNFYEGGWNTLTKYGLGASPPTNTTGTINVFSAVTSTAVSQVSQLVLAQTPGTTIAGTPTSCSGFPCGNSAEYDCPAGSVMIGMRSSGYDNQGTVLLNTPLCGALTPAATAAGVSLGAASPSNPIDGGSNGSRVPDTPPYTCPTGYVVNGVAYAKSTQVDYGYCYQLSSSDGIMTIGSPSLITAGNTYTNYYCPAGSVIVGGKNAPAKNDSWNGFYCAPITYSKNTVTAGYPVSSSWTFTTSTPGADDPCATGSCTGYQANYPNQATGTYTINPIALSAGPTYALAPAAASPIAEQGAPARQAPIAASPSARGNPLVSFLKDIFTSVAQAFGFPPTNPQTQSLYAGGTANFVILWDPVAQLDASPSSLSLTQASPNGVITVSNPGAVGSALNWTDTVSYGPGPTGWLSLQSAGSVMGGSSENIAATADVASIPPGSCTASSPCTATATFRGKSEPKDTDAQTPGGAYTVPITITLTMTNPPPQVTIGPPATVAACVPVTTTCSGGNGIYAWSASPGATINGSGGSVEVSSCSPGTYGVTCTSAGLSSSTQLTVVPGCTLSASPTVLVPPQTAKLTWSCQPDTVTSCSIAGGSQNWNVCGSVASCNANSGSSVYASPAATTLYQLTCAANNSPPPSYTLTQTVTVSIQAPGRVETSSLGVP